MRPIKIWIVSVMLMLEMLGLMFSIFTFMSGFHSLDLARDVTLLTKMLDGRADNYVECTLEGNCYSFGDTYVMGLSTLLRGYYSTILMMAVMILTVPLLIESIKYRYLGI